VAYIPTPEEAAANEARWVELWIEGKAPTKAEMPYSSREPTVKDALRRELQRIGPVHNPERGGEPVDKSVWAETIRKEEERDAARRAREDVSTAQQAHVRARRIEGITTHTRRNTSWLTKT